MKFHFCLLALSAAFLGCSSSQQQELEQEVVNDNGFDNDVFANEFSENQFDQGNNQKESNNGSTDQVVDLNNQFGLGQGEQEFSNNNLGNNGSGQGQALIQQDLENNLFTSPSQGELIGQENSQFFNQEVPLDNQYGPTNQLSINSQTITQSSVGELEVVPPANEQLVPIPVTPSNTLTWVGYEQDDAQGTTKVSILTDGSPDYELVQEKNQAGQPELIVRFLDTKLKNTMRRPLDASEFRSPIAFVRMIENTENSYTDVILTLRENIVPKLFAEKGNVQVSVEIPSRYKVDSISKSAADTATFLSDASVIPTIVEGSQRPKGDIAAFAPDPGGDLFGSDAEGSEVAFPEEQFGQNQFLDNTAFPNNTNSLISKDNLSLNGTGIYENINTPQNQGNIQTNVKGQFEQNYVDEDELSNAEQVNQFDNDDFDNGEQINFDDDDFDNFDDDDGEGESETEKFEVNRSLNETSKLAIVESFGVFAVAQDEFALEDDVDQDLVIENQSNTENNLPLQSAPPEGNLFEQTSSQLNTQNQVDNYSLDNGSGEVNILSNQGTNLNGQFIENTGFETEQFFDNNLGTESNRFQQDIVVDENFAPQPLPDEEVGFEDSELSVESGRGAAIQLEFRDAPLSAVIAAISEESLVNFVYPPSIGNFRVNLKLRGVPWDDALKAVLETNGLGLVEMGSNVIRIERIEVLNMEKRQLQEARDNAARLIDTKVLIMRMSYANIEEVKNVIEKMLSASMEIDPRVKVSVDKRTNSLVVEAIPTDLAKVKAMVERLDLKTPQVKIAARIVEVLRSLDDFVGLSWFAPLNFDQARGLGFGNLVFPNYINSSYAIDVRNQSAGRFAFNIGSLNGVTELDVFLDMQVTNGITEILQSNDILVQNNETAKIEAGITDYVRNVFEIFEVDYQITTEVTPHIASDGSVRMELKIESTDPVPSIAVGSIAAKNSRLIETTLIRNSGETAVIGGLNTTNTQTTETGIPILSSIPIIGSLFGSKQVQDRRRELLIMLTPTIVDSTGSLETGGSIPALDVGSENLSLNGNAFEGNNVFGNEQVGNDQINVQQQGGGVQFENQGIQQQSSNNQFNDGFEENQGGNFDQFETSNANESLGNSQVNNFNQNSNEGTFEFENSNESESNNDSFDQEFEEGQANDQEFL